MRVKALRGVCIGVDRHMKPGDSADLDAATVTFLVGIGAVEKIAEAMPSLLPDEPETKPMPEKSGSRKEK